jgi:hypothetical protein
MDCDFITFDPIGYWEGNCIEFDLLLSDNNIIEETSGKLTKFINKYQGNTYIVTDTYYSKNGSISFGPVDYLLNTNGTNKFTCECQGGACISSYLFTNEQMTINFQFNIVEGNTVKSFSGLCNLIKKNLLILNEQIRSFNNIDCAINTLISYNRILATGITETVFPNLEFIVDNNQTLDFTDIKIFLNKNGSLEPIVVNGVYDIVKSKYDAVAKQAVAAGSSPFEPFKLGFLNGKSIGEVIDELTNNQTYGIIKVFSMTLRDNSE